MTSNIIDALQHLSVPIVEVFSDEANAVEHSEASIVAISQSLSNYGQRKPIVVNAKTHVVEAGNGTLIAARDRLGWSHIAAVYVNDDKATATSYAVADNRSAQLARWNYKQLMRSIASAGQALPGVSPEFLAAARIAAAGGGVSPIQAGNVPAPAPPPSQQAQQDDVEYDEDDREPNPYAGGGSGNGAGSSPYSGFSPDTSRATHFDASNLPDATPAQTDVRSYVIYVAFSTADAFERGLRILSLGQRSVSPSLTQRFAQLDGVDHYHIWEAALAQLAL
jgi:hypothetical protein